MAILHARPLEADDLKVILRPEALKGLTALGLSGPEAIALSARNSVECYSVFLGKEPLGVWGYSTKSALSDVAYPWMLATEAVDEHKVLFARHSRQVVNYLAGRFRRLESFILAEDLRALHWMNWLKFKMQGPAIPLGKGQFVYMVREDGRSG